MPKQYVHALIEPEAKEQLEQIRSKFGLPSLSATIIYLIDNLPAGKRKPRQENDNKHLNN